MKNNFAALSCLFLALAVVLGAWNAHGMEQLVTDGKMSLKYIKTFHTGVQYQFFTSLGLLALSLAFPKPRGTVKWGMLSLLLGMCIFSFSLYFLALNELLSPSLKILGAIAPIGGLLMALGWLLCSVYFVKNQKLSA